MFNQTSSFFTLNLNPTKTIYSPFVSSIHLELWYHDFFLISVFNSSRPNLNPASSAGCSGGGAATCRSGISINESSYASYREGLWILNYSTCAWNDCGPILFTVLYVSHVGLDQYFPVGILHSSDGSEAASQHARSLPILSFFQWRPLYFTNAI